MKRLVTIIALAGFMSLAAVGVRQAEAVPMLKLIDTATMTIVTITDNVGLDGSTTLGNINYNGAVGGYNVNVTAGLTKPAIGSAGLPFFHLSSGNVTGASAGSLQILFTETDFSTPMASTFVTNIGGVTNGSMRYKTYFDNGNTVFGTGTLISDSGVINSPGGFVGATVSLSSFSPVPTNPYSITLFAEVTHTLGSDVSSFDATLQNVPEPSSLLLLGSGLIGLGFIRRKLKV